MTLINPYVEWTGYVANVGFEIVELIENKDRGMVRAFGKASKLGVITIGSFLFFSAHYLLRIEYTIFSSIKGQVFCEKYSSKCSN